MDDTDAPLSATAGPGSPDACAPARAGGGTGHGRTAGCTWCSRWNAEIAPVYPKTAEGEFAPLRRVALHDMPADLQVQRPVLFTPTFLLVEDGHELARLEGYPGEDFFWPLLNGLLSAHTGFAETSITPDGS